MFIGKAVALGSVYPFAKILRKYRSVACSSMILFPLPLFSDRISHFTGMISRFLRDAVFHFQLLHSTKPRCMCVDFVILFTSAKRSSGNCLAACHMSWNKRLFFVIIQVLWKTWLLFAIAELCEKQWLFAHNLRAKFWWYEPENLFITLRRYFLSTLWVCFKSSSSGYFGPYSGEPLI